MAYTNELREQRGSIAAEMTKLVELAAKENRDFTAEENQKFDKMNTDCEALRSRIEKAEKVDSLNAELQQVRSLPIENKVVTQFSNPQQDQMGAWRSYLRLGINELNPAESAVIRSLGTGTGSSGGYVAPAQVTNEFIKTLRDFTGVLQAPVRVWQTASGNEIPFPTVNDTSSAAEKVDENPASAIGDTTDPTFGQIKLNAYNYSSGVVRISKQLLQDSVIPIESLLNELLAERLGAKLNNVYTLGDGSGDPEGIVVGAADSGLTLPATTLGATADVVYQNMQTAIHSIAPIYRKKPSFGMMFNDNTLLALKKLVDANKQPLWVASMSAGEPDRICGVPYYINVDMADIGANNKSIVVADFSQFYVRQVASVEFVRMPELYARYLEIGFMAWLRTDSAVMNSAAVKWVDHAAS